MDSATLRSQLREGRRVFGTLVISDSPRWPNAIGGTGLDFVFIDTEHVALGITQVATMCQMYRGIDLAPMVRVPEPDPTIAAKMIDVGAGGVIAPYIESPEQVLRLVGAIRWRPLKGKRLAAKLDGEMLEPELESYLEERNASNVLILNIESVPAMESLHEVLAVPGIDSVLIGPHDLSCSLGVPEQYDHPDFLAACERIFTAARSRGIGAGIHFTGDVAKQVRFMELGANMIIHCADLSIFARHLKQDLDALRQSIGEQRVSVADDIDAI